MAQEEKEAPTSESKPDAPDRGSPPPTPFDHPLFLPVLLVAGMLWFGYDGWIETDPDMLEHRTFNRVGFVLLTIAAAWFGRSGIRDWKLDQERKERSEGGRDKRG